MLATTNDFEMTPMGASKAYAAQIPAQQLHSPFPNYYYMQPSQPVVPMTSIGYAPYYGAPTSAVYPIYPVTQYPVFTVPTQAPLLPHQQFTTQPVYNAPSAVDSGLPTYTQLFPPSPQKQATAQKPILYEDDKDFFEALRPEPSIRTEKLNLPHLERLMQDIKVEATSELVKNSQQRCKNCCNYYAEDQNHEKACFYHSGRFKTPETVRPIMMPISNLQRWTCCRQTSKDALGCKSGYHVRDEETTKIIDRFSSAAASAAPRKRVHDSGLLVQLDDDGDDEWKELKQNSEALSKEMLVFQKFHGGLALPPPSAENQIAKNEEGQSEGTQGAGSKIVKHTVLLTDTIAGLALKYGVKAADIKRANNLLGDSIFERKTLDIPNPTRIPDQEELDEATMPKCGREAIAIGRFVAAAKCDKNEAKFYLADNDWDLPKALANFFADEEWAKAHPFPQNRKRM